MESAVGESAVPDGYEITYVADEPRRVTGGVTTLFGTNEGSLVKSDSCWLRPVITIAPVECFVILLPCLNAGLGVRNGIRPVKILHQESPKFFSKDFWGDMV